MIPRPIMHEVVNADGSKTQFTAVPFMTLEEAREVGAQKINDPNFIQGKIDAALKKAAK